MPKKRGPLNKAEKFYLDNNDTPVEELAEDLNRSEKVINTYLTSTDNLQSPNTHTVGSLMGGKTGSGRKGVAVMTPAASELSDATRKIEPMDRSGHVWKIKNDE